MKIITQIKISEEQDRASRAEQLVKETKVLNIARLAKMLVDLFGLDEPFKKIGKFEGQEIEMYLKELDGYITFTLTSERKNFECTAQKAISPIARLTITVKEEKILQVLSSIIRSKNNIFGPQPFFAIKTKSNQYFWDNLDFQGTNQWSYTFDYNTLDIDDIDRVGIAANTDNGLTEVLVINIKTEEIIKKILNN